MVGDSCRARTFDSSDNPCSRSRNQLACNSDSTRLACRWARTSFFDLESKPSEISCAAAATLYRNDLVCGRIAETHRGRTDLGEGTINIDERGNSNPLRNTLQLDAQRIELLLSNYAQRRVGYGPRSPFGPALRTPLVVFPPILPALARLTNFLTLINCC